MLFIQGAMPLIDAFNYFLPSTRVPPYLGLFCPDCYWPPPTSRREIHACQADVWSLSPQSSEWNYNLFWTCASLLAKTRRCHLCPGRLCAIVTLHWTGRKHNQSPDSGHVPSTRPAEHNTMRNAYVTADRRNAYVTPGPRNGRCFITAFQRSGLVD